MPLQAVSQLEVLRNLLTSDAAYEEALDYRLSKGERVFRKYQRVLCGKGSHKENMLVWETSGMASVSYCSGTLSLTKELARHPQS